MTKRQKFICELRSKQGKSFDEIGIEYQKQFRTKTKLSRSKIMDILAQFGLWGSRMDLQICRWCGFAIEDDVSFISFSEAKYHVECFDIMICPEERL